MLLEVCVSVHPGRIPTLTKRNLETDHERELNKYNLERCFDMELRSGDLLGPTIHKIAVFLGKAGHKSLETHPSARSDSR